MSLYADKTHQNLGGGSFCTPEVGVVQNIERYFCERTMVVPRYFCGTVYCYIFVPDNLLPDNFVAR